MQKTRWSYTITVKIPEAKQEAVCFGLRRRTDTRHSRTQGGRRPTAISDFGPLNWRITLLNLPLLTVMDATGLTTANIWLIFWLIFWLTRYATHRLDEKHWTQYN
jgi:hypothetical protein